MKRFFLVFLCSMFLVGNVAYAATQPSRSQQLIDQINSVLHTYSDIRTGVSLIELPQNTVTTFGYSSTFEGASTTKILTALDYLHEVELGHFSLSQIIQKQTALWQLQQMINQSNNDSWAALNNNLGWNRIIDYAKAIGLTSYNCNNNLISAYDDSKMLEKLYEGALVNSSHTKLLLSWMQHTNDESLIPAALPTGTVLYHKYGWLNDAAGNFLHDSAIIVTKKQSFVLSIYTNRLSGASYLRQSNAIHSITRIIYAAESS